MESRLSPNDVAYDDAITSLSIEGTRKAEHYENIVTRPTGTLAEDRIDKAGQYDTLEAGARCTEYASPYDSLKD